LKKAAAICDRPAFATQANKIVVISRYAGFLARMNTLANLPSAFGATPS
jgi:hypothetical protein